MILNAAECEPLLHKDKEMLRAFPDETIAGLERARHIIRYLARRNFEYLTLFGFSTENWNRPDAEAEAFRDGWFHTGDVVRQEADGSMFFVDRKKNVIRRSGENIAAVEVESALIEHPAVAEAGVIGLPANDGTPRVWYSLLRPERDGIAVETHALAYDHVSAAAAIRAADLPDDWRLTYYANAFSAVLVPHDLWSVAPTAAATRLTTDNRSALRRVS